MVLRCDIRILSTKIGIEVLLCKYIPIGNLLAGWKVLGTGCTFPIQSLTYINFLTGKKVPNILAPLTKPFYLCVHKGECV